MSLQTENLTPAHACAIQLSPKVKNGNHSNNASPRHSAQQQQQQHEVDEQQQGSSSQKQQQQQHTAAWALSQNELQVILRNVKLLYDWKLVEEQYFHYVAWEEFFTLFCSLLYILYPPYSRLTYCTKQFQCYNVLHELNIDYSNNWRCTGPRVNFKEMDFSGKCNDISLMWTWDLILWKVIFTVNLVHCWQIPLDG